jgi:diacylglycerol kinase family enzyme
MITHIMKTTLDLSDNLLIAAKALAAQRKTTLKAMVEHALRREITPQENLAPDSLYEVGPFGILSLKKRTEGLTAEQVQHLVENQHAEEDARIISISTRNS